MPSKNTNKSQKIDKTLDVFTRNPSKVFILAIAFIFLVFAGLSGAAYFDYLSDLKISDIFPSLLTTASVLFSALWASTFVVKNMNVSRETAKLHETLTLIRAAELDREFIDARSVWSKYRSMENYDENMASLMAAFLLDVKDLKVNDVEFPANDAVSNSLVNEEALRREASLMVTYFNFFELSSLAIKKEIMHEELFKEWYGTNFIRTWNISVHAISALRKLHDNRRLFTEWQLRSKLWAQELGLSVREPHDYRIKDLMKLAIKRHAVRT